MRESNIIPGFGQSFASDPATESSAEAHNIERTFLEHFGLNEQPFGVTPDPRFLYLGPKHRQALAALTFGTELNRGFLTLIAKPGMGKTSLLFQYLEGLRNKARTVFLFQTIGDARDLMAYLLDDLGLDSAGKDLPRMNSVLNQALMDEMCIGRRLVLVIDEAQNLDEKVLESVRLLSNFETPWMKLIQIILAGQPQLAEKLARPSMAQLRQRISFSIRIEPLNREEIDAYVDHRLWVAGYKGPRLFSIGARTLIAEHSEGIPRIINNVCFCAMSLGWATKTKVIDREMIRDVLADLDPGWLTDKAEPKVAEELKQTVQTPPKFPALTTTIKEPPSRQWLTNSAIVTVVLFVLVWSAIHFDLKKRLVSFLHEIQGAVRISVVPTPTSQLLVPAIPITPNTSLLNRSSNTTESWDA